MMTVMSVLLKSLSKQEVRNSSIRSGFFSNIQRFSFSIQKVRQASEVIDQGKYGLMVEVQSVSDLAEKMKQIEADTALRETLSSLGRERAEQYFDRPIMLNNILVDMNEIVAGK